MMKKTPDVEKTVRDIRRHTRKLPKRKSGLSSKDCAAKTVLPSFVTVWHYRTAWICVAQLCLLFQEDH